MACCDASSLTRDREHVGGYDSAASTPGADNMTITIKVRATGAYFIDDVDKSQINLVDHEGNPIPFPEGKKGIALCRCGGSTTKPFCDGTHSRTGFLAAEAAVRAAAQAEAKSADATKPAPEKDA
jgi:CDGSH-type Zn-finger protein